MKSICMISCLHGGFDDRIYWKECLSLKKKGYHVTHIYVGNEDKQYTSIHAINMIEIQNKRYFYNPYVDKLYKTLFTKNNIYTKILQQAAALNADVYHIHDIQINKIISRLKQKRPDAKFIYDVHEDFYEQILSYLPKNWLFRLAAIIHARRQKQWEIASLVHHDHIIAVYPRIVEKFSTHYPIEKITIIYNYTNLVPQTKVESALESRTYDVIYAGLIAESRCIKEILAASLLVKNCKPDFKLLLIGPIQHEKLRKSISNFITKNHLEENIILKDPVNQDKLVEYYLQSKIALAIFKPIPIFQFAVQVKTFEYMIFGLPIICNSFGYIHHFVLESNAGIAIPDDRPASIADAILELLSNKMLYSTLSNNGKNAALSRYHWNFEEKKLFAVYEEILN